MQQWQREWYHEGRAKRNIVVQGESGPPPSPPATLANPLKIRLKYGYQIPSWKPPFER